MRRGARIRHIATPTLWVQKLDMESLQDYHQSFNAWKRCRRHKDVPGVNIASILDRFQRDPIYRAFLEVHGWTAQKVHRY